MRRQVAHMEIPTKLTRKGRMRRPQISRSQISSKGVQRAREKAKTKNGSLCRKSSRACILGHLKEIKLALATILGLANKEQLAHANMCARCLGVIRITLKQSTNDHKVRQFHPMLEERPNQQMDNERAEIIGDVKSELGSSGYFCIGSFCGSGNLTFAMEIFFGWFRCGSRNCKAMSQGYLFGLTREDHYELVTGGHFLVDICGSISEYLAVRSQRHHLGSLAKNVMDHHLFAVYDGLMSYLEFLV